MNRRTRAVLLVAAVAVLPACRPVDAETGTQAIANATQMQCNDARRALEQAVENFELLEGKLPRSEAALVPGYLVTQSPYMDLDEESHVVPAPGSGCR